MNFADCFRLPRSRGELVYALTVAGLIAGMLLCLPLWKTERDFPHLPLWAWCPPLPAPADAVLLWGTLLVAAASVFSPRLTWTAVAGCLLMAVQDQVRWQPWCFQYVLLLVLAALVKDRRGDAWLLVCRVVMVGLYAWSGLHKLTPAYANMYESTFTVPLSTQWPAWAAGLVRGTAGAGPWLEMAMAAALCFRRTRRAGAVMAAAAHLWIMALIGPLGLNYNPVVWPWNGIMAAVVLVLFWRAPVFGWKSLNGAAPYAAASLAVLLCGVMPALSIWEKWDRYLSFHLYSGSERRIVVILDAAAVAAMPPGWRAQVTASGSPEAPEAKELRFHEWALRELGVPVPADERHLLTLARRCATMDFALRGQVLFYTDFALLVKERGFGIFTAQQIREMRHIPAHQAWSNAPGR